MTGTYDDALIAAEVEKALARPGPFLILPHNLEGVPGARQQFAAAAKAAGRTLGLEPHNPAIDAARARLAENSDAPAVDRNDHRAFLQNLKGIATGAVRVK